MKKLIISSTFIVPLLTIAIALHYLLATNAYAIEQRLPSIPVLINMAAQGDVDAMRALGRAYYFRKEYTESARWYGKAADLNDNYAQYYLAQMYDEGKGLTQSYADAVAWYTKAANQSNILAQCSLAKHLLEGLGVKQDVQAAIIWYTKAADQRYQDAMYELGYIYYEGKYVDKSYDKAAQWFERAGWYGHELANYTLSHMYSEGLGVTQDHAKAAEYLQLAANHYFMRAEKELGLMYLQGKGVPQDYDKAAYWLFHAAIHGENGKDGDVEAGEIAFKLYIQEKAQVNPNDELRFRYLAVSGKVEAQLIMGLIYLKGKGVLRNYREAERWFSNAASKRNADAQYYLGMMYKDGFMDGEQLVKNPESAATLLKKAAAQGHPEAQKQVILLASGVSSPSQPYTLPYAKEFGTPQFAQGIPYSQFKKYLNDEITSKYFALWKKVFMTSNSLSEEEFENKLLFITASNTWTSVNGDFFTVSYFVVIDWLKVIARSTGFPIVWPPSREEYKYLNLRSGVYLDEDEIIKYLVKGNNYQLFKIDLKHHLAFHTKQDAVSKLKQALEVDNIPEDKLVTEVVYGGPVISTFITINRHDNYCKSGRVDLITGKLEVSRAACVVY